MLASRGQDLVIPSKPQRLSDMLARSQRVTQYCRTGAITLLYKKHALASARVLMTHTEHRTCTSTAGCRM